MNSALLYLQFTLSKRRAIRFAWSLSNPGKCIGLLALAGLTACLIHVSDDPVFDRLFQRSSLTALATTWLAVSVFRGWMRRGLIFEPADIEFLIPGPFRMRELVYYRLLPGYGSALLAGVIFFALAQKRFANPVWAAIAVVLLQLLCSHLSVAASILAGTFFRGAWVAQSEMTAEGPCRMRPSEASHHSLARSWARSVSLLFTGARSLLWKQWLQAMRTKREIYYAAAITIAYAMAVKFGADGHIAEFNAANDTGLVSTEEHQGWMMLAAINATIWLGFLGWILQRTCPFDFRSDSRRIAELRILPFLPSATVLAQLAMPVLLTLLFQFAALIALTWIGTTQVRTLWFALVSFPALTFGFHAAGNISCLLFANRAEDSDGSTASTGLMRTFLMMALSLGVIAPSAAIYIKLFRSLVPASAFFLSAGVQYGIDALLVVILARLFQHCELARELQ